MPTTNCLNRFPRHSWNPWFFHTIDRQYERECSLLGCKERERTAQLLPVGKEQLLPKVCADPHDFGPWQCTAGRDGTYLPPYKYERTCMHCGTIHRCENLIPC